jgi:hypothetical protein
MAQRVVIVRHLDVIVLVDSLLSGKQGLGNARFHRDIVKQANIPIGDVLVGKQLQVLKPMVNVRLDGAVPFSTA